MTSLMLMLIQKLVDNNRFDDIAKIKDNKDYRQIFMEYMPIPILSWHRKQEGALLLFLLKNIPHGAESH